MSEERVSLAHRLQYLIFMGFCGGIRLLPAWLVWRLFAAASLVGYLIDGNHRRLALRNLDTAYGSSLTAREKRRIARGSFKALFLMAAELLYTPRLAGRLDDLITLNGVPRIREAFLKGKGIIFMISHYGNWEIMAYAGARECGGRLVSVGRPFPNPLVYEEILRLRNLIGGVMLRKKWVSAEIIQALRNNWGVAILMDQYAGRFAPFVPFFGTPVSTTPAIALLALKTGATVIPVFNVRQGFGRHESFVCEPVEMPDTGDMEADVAEHCARCNRVIEEWVRRHPDQWLWMARRWRRKKRPEEP